MIISIITDIFLTVNSQISKFVQITSIQLDRPVLACLPGSLWRLINERSCIAIYHVRKVYMSKDFAYKMLSCAATLPECKQACGFCSQLQVFPLGF